MNYPFYHQIGKGPLLAMSQWPVRQQIRLLLKSHPHCLCLAFESTYFNDPLLQESLSLCSLSVIQYYFLPLKLYPATLHRSMAQAVEKKTADPTNWEKVFILMQRLSFASKT